MGHGPGVVFDAFDGRDHGLLKRIPLGIDAERRADRPVREAPEVRAYQARA